MRERSLDELAEDLADLKIEIHTLVRSDLHNEQIARIRDDLAGLKHLTMWTLGILCTSIIGAIVVSVVRIGAGT